MWTGGKFTEVKIGDDVFTVRQRSMQHVSFIMILYMPELKAGNGGVPLAVTTKTD